MHRIYVIIILLCASLQVSAQFNDSINYFFRYGSTGIINKTNDISAYTLNNALKFSIYKKNYSLNTNNNWIYGKQQKQLANNDFTSSIDFDVFKTDKHIYYWGLLTYEKSFSLKINNRFQGGLGVGYYFIDSESFVIQISNGVLYEKNDFFSSENLGNSSYETYRNSFRFKFRWVVKDRLTLDHVDFIQHSFSDKNDYNLRSITTISLQLKQWISLTIALNYNKLNLTGRENLLLNYGVTVQQYF